MFERLRSFNEKIDGLVLEFLFVLVDGHLRLVELQPFADPRYQQNPDYHQRHRHDFLSRRVNNFVPIPDRRECSSGLDQSCRVK